MSAYQKLLGTHTTSHHIAWCPCTDYTKSSCLRKSLDGASPFVSAIAIRLTPSYTSYMYTTVGPCSDGAVRADDGRAFHARAAVTGKARSPSVVRRVVHITAGSLAERISCPQLGR